MRIQYLNGGLANQVYQYLFFRFGQLSNPETAEEWFLDDSFFFVHDVHNGYELEKVFPGAKVNLLSKFFDEESWEMLIEQKKNGISVPQSLMNLGYPVHMIAETGNYMEAQHNPFDGPVIMAPGVNGFYPELVKREEEIIYYHGYWINSGYIKAFAETLCEELAFPDITDVNNAKMALDIIKTDSCAVHIRRGDYVQIGWTSSDDFYKNGVQKILEHNPDAVFFVFSDDIPWCKQNAESLGLHLPKRVVYVDGNTKGKNYIDLQLMTYAKYMIRGNSAFSLLAGMLNGRCEMMMRDLR